jgi:DNA-binding CsgD family transcriptional regulator
MTRLILIQPDQTFAYQELTQPFEQVLWDVQVDGKLPDYIKAGNFARNAAVKYSVTSWQDWLVLLPVELNAVPTAQPGNGSRLTRRQLDVLECLSQGLTGKQIAGRLNIHQRSVSLHISALKRNLNANTAAECVQKAARLGILKPDG